MSDQSANKSNNPDKADPPPEQRQTRLGNERFQSIYSTVESVLCIQRELATLTEFPGESFKECTGCREEVELKKTIIQQHIKSSKHSRGKEKLAVKESREQDIADIGY